MPEVINDKTIFSLLEVTKSIQKTISDRYKSLFWVKAEMNKLNHYKHSGHCYPELVEKKDGKIVAEIRSILWKSDFERVNAQFIKLLNEPLRDGITIYFQAGISYDPLHGLSLRIVDIDVSFVLGELEKEKKESIFRLQEEGLFDANKRIPFPLIPKRLAIISVETSKGLSDFYKIINNNPWGYKIETTLYPALLQGDKSIASIIKQMAVIAERTDQYDAVAIIRGGGGEVGLSSYNNYHLSKAIAIFPIPVLTGIGHSTNETVSEMVAYKNAITPSELADFLIQKFHNFAIPLDNAQKQLILAINNLFHTERSKLQNAVQTINWSSINNIKSEQHQISLLAQKLQLYSEHFIKQQHHELDNLSRLIKMADPHLLLKRGFSISRKNGKAITSKEEINIGDEIETLFVDGLVTSTVTQKK
ncbi:exodeoxyribonuclease VII large subunit [Sphingobacterium rhinopitheci]|uniref:exodeoxyribonuclease VII large subunit n=1 Tax=Sphingobacterium rhinopitheci TaxID=2781960 RepID=UPI001F518E0F|nr:exodeoxyribonuclease VII large subunit [Sphingobacterium rhinopitheci]MCI0921524.1 exodeoxyribonuclease VII large subunit [Sphingobacterium rhinopitheci]